MGEIKCFKKYKLVVGVLISAPELKEKVVKTLINNFGDADFISENFKFTFTDYYNKEMGDEILRFFVSFSALTDPEKLPEIKILTNKLEIRFMQDENRHVNLDPGLLNDSRLILASTKDNVHRVPLSDGIYAEITLIYKKGNFETLPWTYADFRSPDYQKILKDIRGKYKQDLQKAESV